ATTIAHIARTTPAPDCRSTVAAAFSNSVEYNTLFVTNEYLTLLNRRPDPAGLAGWVGALEHGTRDEQIEAAIAASAEYLANYGVVGPSWVQVHYHDILGRTVSNAEVQAWLQVIGNGPSPTTVATGFAGSAEREARAVENYYLRFLGRTASTAEVNGW